MGRFMVGRGEGFGWGKWGWLMLGNGGRGGYRLEKVEGYRWERGRFMVEG